ncbi:hypothetical protein ACVXG7_08670 [Enterobacter hormaechei]
MMVRAIPFDTRKPSSLFIPQRWQTFSRPARQQSARYASGAQTLNVQQRTESAAADFRGDGGPRRVAHSHAAGE